MPSCRFCSTRLTEVFADLGMSPLANSYLKREQLAVMEPFYPLRAWVCGSCKLVQLEEFEKPDEIFADYAYFSSVSTSWLAHAERYVAHIIERFGFGPQSQVIEIASNDGYLLQYFHSRGVPVLGIEPARNIAQTAIAKGIPTRVEFFGHESATRLAAEGIRADLLIGNNVYAHVPDLHSFTQGIHTILKPAGVVTLEFPHLLQLMQESQFDTIYHEHFSYFSLLVVQQIFERHDLKIFDVQQLPTHGGSLRVFGTCKENDALSICDSVHHVLEQERKAGLGNAAAYRAFATRVVQMKCDLLEFLIAAWRSGKAVAGYGAPAKGNTLLNYCGIGPELLPYTVDLSPHKQGLYLPGTHIPIAAPERIAETRPDYVLILPWNLKDEITAQMRHVRDWGGRFVVAIPSLQVF
jgi:2-polyprenyl-3-methyl-5-hydroxy-6-metoxy-1,4-benzoquinol methylase